MSTPTHEHWAMMLARARAFAGRDPNGALTRTRLLLREIDDAIARGDANAGDFRAQVAAEYASHQAALAQFDTEAAKRSDAYHERIRRENAGDGPR